MQTAHERWLVPRRKLNGAMPGDKVLVAPLPQSGYGMRKQAMGKAPRGYVSAVVERAASELVGRYEKNGALGVVVPLDERISFDVFMDAHANAEARSGDMVVAGIDVYPCGGVSAQGHILRVLGAGADPSVLREAQLMVHGFEARFTQEAQDEAASLALDVASALDQPGRVDLRSRHVLTIDPKTAKDFDDALSFERLEGGNVRLGVHIADVAEYVPWDGAIDAEARDRATSVYLVDAVVAMLPERLSDDLCSLCPCCDRLAMTIDITLDAEGRVVDSDMRPSVIRSGARLDYDSVDDMLCGEAPWASFEDGESVEETLCGLDALAGLLHARRIAHGGVDLETAEAEVVLNPDGEPQDVLIRKRTRATALVEEAMILANCEVAGHLERHGAPCVYRIHEKPSGDSLAALLPVLEEFGYSRDEIYGGDAHAYQELLRGIKGKPEEQLINTLVLRSMRRAVYSPKNKGHFGLGIDAYCHFTSPIRRYPDLIVHRILKAQLSSAAQNAQMVDSLEWLAEHSSAKEREAADAERESVEAKLLEYLAARVGDVFDGVVSGISRDGIFVRLDITCEGVVPRRELGEHLTYDKQKRQLEGEVSGIRYRLGKRVRVRVVEVEPARRMLRLRFAE